MPHIVIDGKNIEAQPGKTVIQAAFDNGIDIPHFCWHPELSVSGNCRMCLVEIGMPKRLQDGTFALDADGKQEISYFPKLQIACATQITDGMHVRTNSQAVINAQEAVMEFLLINHPLDCPICDEAGQCKLQEYAFLHSKGESRFDDPKNHKDKRVSWGPNVLFDAERCISCSRCIRFADEIAGQNVLTFVNRGDHVTIELFEGKEFDSPYSMNVIDICPVGALTSKDFRFKSRVSDMNFNESICQGCASGCNIKIGVRNNEILRIEPAANPHVNKFWMCDYGRLSQYKFVNENRIKNPILKIDNTFKEAVWQEATNYAAQTLKLYKNNEILVLGSAYATNEDNYLLMKFAKTILKTNNLYVLSHNDEHFGDDFLKKNDKTPNLAGVAELGFSILNKENINTLIEKINHHLFKAIYLLDNRLDDYPELINSFQKLETIIIHSSNYSDLTENSEVILASSTYAEIEGTVTNFSGRVQHFSPALTTSENIRYMGMKMGRLDKFGAPNDRWTQHELRNSLPHWRIIQMIANIFGASWKYHNPESIFDEITVSYPRFKGMSYELLDEYKGLLLGKADKPEPAVRIYESHYFKPD